MPVKTGNSLLGSATGFVVAAALVVATGCTKANAPTTAHFESAIRTFMSKFPDKFAINKQVSNRVDPKQPDTSFPDFDALKNRGIYQEKTVYHNETKTTIESNPNFTAEQTAYDHALKEFAREKHVWEAKVTRIKARYAAVVHAYTKRVIDPKRAWCNVPGHGLYGNDPTYCQAVNQGLAGVKSVMAYDPINMATFLQGRRPPEDPVYPPKPVKPAALLAGPPSKTMSVNHVDKVADHVYVLNTDNPGVVCRNKNTCHILVGQYVLDKIISATAPANAGGAIVSEVTAVFRPKMNLPAKETRLRTVKFAMVQNTNGWSVDSIEP